MLDLTFGIVILFGTWDYLLSMVGVDHLGSMKSSGSVFYFYLLNPIVWCRGLGVPCVFCSCVLCGMVIPNVLYLISWILRDDVIYFYDIYSFRFWYPITYTLDDCAIWLLPSGIQDNCILFKWIHTCSYSFMWMCYLLDILLFKFKCDSMSWDP